MNNLNNIPRKKENKSKVLESIKSLNKKHIEIADNIYSKFTNWVWDRFYCIDNKKLPGCLKKLFIKLEESYQKYDIASGMENDKLNNRWFGYAQRHAKIWFSTTRTDSIKTKIEILEEQINKIKDSEDLIVPIKILKHDFRFFYNQEEYWIWKYWVVWSTERESKECDWWNHVKPSFRDKVHDFISKNWVKGIFQNDWERVFDFRVIK